MKIKIISLFISDTHLGNPNSQAKKLLEVLKMYEFDNLFIVGDFIDMTYLKRKFYWNIDHSNVIQKILKLSKSKTTIKYIIGNHDYYIRHLIEDGNIKIGDIELCNEFIYESLRGEKILLVHGDCFDSFIKTGAFLYWLGDKSYELSIKINKIYNFFRRMFGFEYWSLSAYLKTKVKNVIKFLSEYKKASDEKISEMGCDSIMMGHTHSPEIIDGKFYNTGDFLESCSYIIEDLNSDIILKFVK